MTGTAKNPTRGNASAYLYALPAFLLTALLAVAGIGLGRGAQSPSHDAGGRIYSMRLAANSAASPSEADPSAPSEPALFDDHDLQPGREVSRCTIVSIPGTGAGQRVVLRADDVTGELSTWLMVRVSVGSGEQNSCADFQGEPLYDGTLAGLGAREDPLDTGWQRAGSSSVASATFRFDVQVADVDTAQGTSASADFEWDAVFASIAPSGTPADPSITVTASPTSRPATAWPSSTSAGSTSAGSTSGPPVGTGSARSSPAVPTATPTGQPAPTARAHPRDTGAAAAVDDPSSPTPSTASTQVTAADHWVALQAVAAGLATRAAFPVALLVLVVVFLLIQNRMDHSDPKLSRAPLFRSPRIQFPHLRAKTRQSESTHSENRVSESRKELP
ncbi:MAG: hypothetical protein JWN95_865 [Frankiales bacterium]|nr:hypothetical protein [Frankiales bacterium]